MQKKYLKKYIYRLYFGTLKKTVRPMITLIISRNGKQLTRKPTKLNRIIKIRGNIKD
jgi:hypothetical protein